MFPLYPMEVLNRKSSPSLFSAAAVVTVFIFDAGSSSLSRHTSIRVSPSAVTARIPTDAPFIPRAPSSLRTASIRFGTILCPCSNPDSCRISPVAFPLANSSPRTCPAVAKSTHVATKIRIFEIFTIPVSYIYYMVYQPLDTRDKSNPAKILKNMRISRIFLKFAFL